MWPQIAREQLGAGNAGFATSWELPGSWEPGSLLRKTASWEAILGIKTTDSDQEGERGEDLSWDAPTIRLVTFSTTTNRKCHKACTNGR